MGAASSLVRDVVYRLLTRSHVILYFMPLVKLWMQRVLDPRTNSNFSITDNSGNEIRVCRVGDRLLPAFGLHRLTTIRDVALRHDDVLLCGYPKSGTHWVHEILYMLVTGRSQLTPHGKGLGGMIEMLPDLLLDSITSPRVLNSHLYPDELPSDVRRLNIKIVLTARNPKDTVVSFYSMVKTLTKSYPDYSGQFTDYFDLFMSGQVEYGSYQDHHLAWDQVLKEGTLQVMLIQYEDMKSEPVRCVHRLADFLNIEVTAGFVQEIVEKTSFQSMKAKRAGNVHFRKGKVGDWRDWLTDEQSIQMDREWERKCANCVYQPFYGDVEHS